MLDIKSDLLMSGPASRDTHNHGMHLERPRVSLHHPRDPRDPMSVPEMEKIPQMFVELVVEPTHLKNMLVKMGSSSPGIGVNICELTPPIVVLEIDFPIDVFLSRLRKKMRLPHHWEAS